MSSVACPVTEAVQDFVVNQFLFGVPGDLKAADSLLDKGVIDSTGVLELVDFVENKFGIKIPDYDMTPANLDGIDRVVSYVKGKLP
jgi:acyl carrier protein